jgi:hypothetical protein
LGFATLFHHPYGQPNRKRCGLIFIIIPKTPLLFEDLFLILIYLCLSYLRVAVKPKTKQKGEENNPQEGKGYKELHVSQPYSLFLKGAKPPVRLMRKLFVLFEPFIVIWIPVLGHVRDFVKVVRWWWRRDEPFQRGRLPRIVGGLFAKFCGEEEVQKGYAHSDGKDESPYGLPLVKDNPALYGRIVCIPSGHALKTNDELQEVK